MWRFKWIFEISYEVHVIKLYTFVKRFHKISFNYDVDFGKSYTLEITDSGTSGKMKFPKFQH